jgi:hypothetical protein
LKSDKTLRALQIHGGAYDILLSILIDVRKLHIMTSGIAVNGAAWPWLGYVSTPVLSTYVIRSLPNLARLSAGRGR